MSTIQGKTDDATTTAVQHKNTFATTRERIKNINGGTESKSRNHKSMKGN